MAVRDGRGDVKQTTTGFRGPLMVQSLTSAKSKFLSLVLIADYKSKNAIISLVAIPLLVLVPIALFELKKKCQ